ncbi:TolC family protein [Pedobacter deserti]|uniref:TolC family protein n=1 Tax=Pedobacter deserti TaxID=2817382 RepID=UPI002109C84F|nr:TolC family protein [Pedobacter sp. SYSU D00382]
MRALFIILFLSLPGLPLVAAASSTVNLQDDTLRLSLSEAVARAKANSIAAKQAITQKETKYWEWRTFRSNYQPQLALSGILPGYNKTYAQVLQPNGTILFQPIRNDNSSLTLDFTQSIAATGGTIFGTTELQRFSDFDRKTVLYNGTPYGIGYTQPLLQFNRLKWDKKIEPLKYRESQQAYIESQEEISMQVAEYFFDLLLAQENLRLAESNFANTEKILSIANTKFELGKIARNEILQLQLERLNAQKAVGTANRDVEIATLNLRTYVGIEEGDRLSAIMPGPVGDISIPTEKVLAEAYENRSDAIAFARRLAEAKRDVAKAKGENGLNATLNANLGYSNAGNRVFDVYRSPKSQQSVVLQLSIPMLDWGRSRSRAKTAQANEQLVVYEVEQARLNFKQEIITQVTLFDMMKEQMTLTARAAEIALEKYQIASERYVLGNLSITDLSIAFQENDRAKRDYIAALRNFWGAYYQLRYLSLYDFEKNEKIRYD